MLKMINAFTEEIDDTDLALSEVMSQLDGKLLSNSVGILTCFSEFIDSGAAELICRKLPFDVVGATTVQNSVDGKDGRLMLTLTVLTSDTVSFATALSGDLSIERERPIADMYNRAHKALDKKPAFILSFSPLIRQLGGDEIIKVLDKATGGLPNFGTMTLDHHYDYCDAQVIYNGESTRTGMAIILVSEGVNPRFRIVSVNEQKIFKQRSVITDSVGSLLKSVDGITAHEYLVSLGLLTDGRVEGTNVTPFIVDYKDGSRPVARVIFAMTDEGYAVCGGEMPKGAAIALSSIDTDDVLATSEQIADEILSMDNVNGVIMFSCLARNLVLGADVFAETERLASRLKGKVPYMISYSSGETCPLTADSGYVNRFHNYTLVVCVL